MSFQKMLMADPDENDFRDRRIVKAEREKNGKKGYNAKKIFKKKELQRKRKEEKWQRKMQKERRRKRAKAAKEKRAAEKKQRKKKKNIFMRICSRIFCCCSAKIDLGPDVKLKEKEYNVERINLDIAESVTSVSDVIEEAYESQTEEEMILQQLVHENNPAELMTEVNPQDTKTQAKKLPKKVVPSKKEKKEKEKEPSTRRVRSSEKLPEAPVPEFPKYSLGFVAPRFPHEYKNLCSWACRGACSCPHTSAELQEEIVRRASKESPQPKESIKKVVFGKAKKMINFLHKKITGSGTP